MPALFELETAASNAWKDKFFVKELNHLLNTYVGRETPLYEAKRLTEHYKTTQASKMSGKDPNASRHCFLVSSPITA